MFVCADYAWLALTLSLPNTQTHKHAGLRHQNDYFGVQAKGDAVDFIKGSKKNVSKPAKATTHYTWKQNARRSLVSVGKQVASTRPDLKVCVCVRDSALAHSSIYCTA